MTHAIIDGTQFHVRNDSEVTVALPQDCHERTHVYIFHGGVSRRIHTNVQSTRQRTSHHHTQTAAAR